MAAVSAHISAGAPLDRRQWNAFARAYGIPFLGMPFEARMQYTATTHANPVRVTFDPLYRPAVELHRASDDPAGRSGPVHYGFRVTPIFERYLYQPVIRAVEWLADRARPIQSGDVSLYLLYVFVAVIVAFAIYAK